MKPIDIVIIVLAVVAVVGITAWTVWKKKTGRGGCCDCDCRGGCSGCPSAQKKSDNSDEK